MAKNRKKIKDYRHYWRCFGLCILPEVELWIDTKRATKYHNLVCGYIIKHNLEKQYLKEHNYYNILELAEKEYNK